MLCMEINDRNIDDYITNLKLKLTEYVDKHEILQNDINLINHDIQKKNVHYDKCCFLKNALTNEMHDLKNISDFIINKNCNDNALIIDLNRFKSVLGTTVDNLLTMKGDVQDINHEILGKFSSLDIQKAKEKPKAPKLSTQVLVSRQTLNPFQYGTMDSGQRLRCIACNEPIVPLSPYLKHMEEYPHGSNVMRPHWYHLMKKCLMARGFQDEYLLGAKVMYEDDMDGNALKTLRDLGFISKNIQSRIDSDTDRKVPDCATKVPPEKDPKRNFYYRRRDPKSGERVVCSSCHGDIRLDAYLTRGDNFDEPLHVSMRCVHSSLTRSSELVTLKCFVYSLLRNNAELNQLTACGFLENKIIGYRPMSAANRDVNRGSPALVAPPPPPPPPPHPQSTIFFYRRNDYQSKRTLTCTGCKTPITQPSYLTHIGDKPFHIKKKCIQSSEARQDDFSQAKVKVLNLLNNFEELQDLLKSGFYKNNIIGKWPQIPNNKPEPCKSTSKEDIASTKDTAFIFNEESFFCQRMIRGERCEACLHPVKKGELGLRHKERIPREKLQETPLISQFYHSSKICLIRRGFTEKYLEYALCHVELSIQDNDQSVRDVLTRCGFVGENIKIGVSSDHHQLPLARPSKVAESESVSPVVPATESFLYIGTCAKHSAHCQGCGFNIASNEACFIYGETAVQDNHCKLFHLSKMCLENAFTGTQMAALVCINNNSMADVNAERIVKCGIANIITRIPPVRAARTDTKRGKRPTGNPLRLQQHTFFVDKVGDDGAVCAACGLRLQTDKYVLQAVSRDDSPSVFMHLSSQCASACGFSPRQLADCDVVLSVPVSPTGRRRLEACGFRDLH